MNFLKKLKPLTFLPIRIINALESERVPFAYYVLTFLSVLALRSLIEPLSTHAPIFLELSLVLHVYLFFIALALSLIILFNIATNTPVNKVARVVLPCFIILIVAPPIDLLVSGAQGLKMGYLFPGVHNDLLWRFLTFGGGGHGFEEFGITPGMKVEVALVLIGSFIYFRTKGSKLWQSIGYTFLCYAVIFGFACIPFIFKGLALLLGVKYSPLTSLFVDFLATLIILFGAIIAYIQNRQYFISVVKDIRLLRLAYYLSMLALGIALGVSDTDFVLTPTNVFLFLFIPVSIFFASLFSIVTNNIADYKIDEVSSPNRPLVSSSISPDTYQRVALPFLGIALFYAALANITTVYFIAILIGNYFLYSMPPLRLKRIPFFSKLTISLNSLVSLMLGFFTITGSLSIPSIAFPLLLIGITAVANVIDIKDYHGDKQTGIRTLPVILGLRRAKILIGSFFMLLYGGIYFVIDFLSAPLYWFPVFLVLGIIQFLLINRKNYNENPVLLAGLFTIGLVIYLIVRYYQPAV